MKIKRFLLGFMFVIFIQMASGQDMRFSFLANPRISWLTQNDNKTESEGAILGYNTGIAADFFFAENYAFSTGLFISQSGGKLAYSDSIFLDTEVGTKQLPSTDPIKYRFQYLSVPLGLKFKTVEIGYITYFVNFGVTPMINIGSSGNTKDDLFDKANLAKETRFLNMDYFINVGAEYSLGGQTAIIGGLGYRAGFIDVTKKNDNVFSRSVSLMVGILF